MATFRSMKLANILALVSAGQAVPGDLLYADDQNPGQLFLVVTGNPNGNPNPALFPMTSLVLSGNYQLQGPPSTVPGPQGEQGPVGPAGPGITTAQMIATAIALG